MVFDWALAGITRSIAGAASAPRPPAITVRRSTPARVAAGIGVVPGIFVLSLMASSLSEIMHGFEMLHHLGT